VITPFVAWNPVPPAARPDPREVAMLIEVPLSALLDPSTVAQEIWERRGRHWRVTFYRFGDHMVWGATARILHDLVGRIKGVRPEADDRPGSIQALDELSAS
jgi:hypothetical protein